MNWDGIELSHVKDVPTNPPTVGGIIYTGARHWFSGEPESGKTLAAYAITLDTLRTDTSEPRETWVVLVDFEMSSRLAKQRFVEMGAEPDELRRILYISPDEPPTDREMYELLIEPPAPTLLVFDAFAGAAGLLGLDDHRGPDIEKFSSTFLTPAWESGITTIVLDHVTKSRENRGGWAAGSQRKRGITDVALGFEAIKQPRRGQDGLIRVTTNKDRFGHLAGPAPQNSP